MILMVIMRDLVRHAYLADIFHPRELLVVPQASPLIAFLLIFIVGLAAIYYMIKLISKPSSEKS
jgi:hypothetical protein